MPFTPGDVSEAQTLTDDDHLYPSHVNELRQSLPFTAIVGTTPNCEYYCDGVDDDVQLQAAIDAAELVGGSVFIKAGDYNFSTGLVTDNKAISIIGEGKSDNANYGVRLNYSGAGSALKINKTSSARFYDFKNFTIVGTSSGAIGLDLVYCPRSQFQNIYVRGFTNGVGINQKHTWGSKFIGCQAEFSNIGWYIETECHHTNYISCDSMHNAYGVKAAGSTSSFRLSNWLGGTVSHNTTEGFFIDNSEAFLIDGVYTESNAVNNANYAYHFKDCNYWRLSNPNFYIFDNPSNTDCIYLENCDLNVIFLPFFRTDLAVGKYNIIFSNDSANNTVFQYQSALTVNYGTATSNNVIPLFGGKINSNVLETRKSLILNEVSSVPHAVATDKADLHMIVSGGKQRLQIRWEDGTTTVIATQT